MKGQGLKEYLLKLIYLALSCAMFYFTHDDIIIGGFGFMYRYLFGIAIVVFAFAVFLVWPNVTRMKVVLKYCGILGMPYLWTALYSFLIWSIDLVQINVMTRGFFFIVYQFIGIFAAAAALYLFGDQGVYMQLGGILLANLLRVIESIVNYGAKAFLEEYRDLLVSLTGKTGIIMKSFEFRGYAYMLGFFLLFFLIDYKKSDKLRWLLLPVIVICFLMGMKRSVMLSVVFALALWVPLLFFKGKAAGKYAMSVCWLGIILGFAYVVACYYGAFDYLELIGIDTNGRADFYRQFRPYYRIGLGYFGKGAGYVSRMMTEGEIILESEGWIAGDIHNDFLRQYVEVGCIGFIVWMWLFLNYRVKYFFHGMKSKRDIKHGAVAFCMIIASYTTFLTENALYFFYPSMTMSLLIMAYHYEDYSDAAVS